MRHPMIVQSRFRCSNHKFRVRERILNQRLFFRTLTASLAGFLFGFDTVVISGAGKTIQSLWELGNFQHGLAMSMALWGYGHWFVVGGRRIKLAKTPASFIKSIRRFFFFCNTFAARSAAMVL